MNLEKCLIHNDSPFCTSLPERGVVSLKTVRSVTSCDTQNLITTDYSGNDYINTYQLIERVWEKFQTKNKFHLPSFECCDLNSVATGNTETTK
jgi:hypothetical protein